MHRRRLLRMVISITTASAATLAQTPPAPRSFHVQPGRTRRPLDVTVRPGDTIRMEAGGCVRFPDGPPRRLLQPDGDQEQSLIFIPGVTLAFAPIADLIGRDLAVPSDLQTPPDPRIWLDWGRYYRSPLETRARPTRSAQLCETGNDAAHLDIRIVSGSPAGAGATASLALELPRYDANLLPLNPRWAGTGRPGVCGPCEGFRVERRPGGSWFVPALSSAACTPQRPYLDAGGCGTLRNECPASAGFRSGRALEGHVNWGPATFTGRLATRGAVHISLDGDAELLLAPDGESGLMRQVAGSKYDGKIILEFSSPETLRWFRTPWWIRFPFRSSSYQSFASFFGRPGRHRGVTGSSPAFRDLPATAIGIFGIDTAHAAHPELHPVYALAVQTESRPESEAWQIFARNWGTEGDCGGRLNHVLDVRRIALTLKSAGDGPWGAADGIFLDHGLATRDWTIYTGARAPTLVIDLPADRRCGVIEGSLTLRRGPSAAAPGGTSHLVSGEPPVGEPPRLAVSPGGDQLCVAAPWFLPVE